MKTTSVILTIIMGFITFQLSSATSQNLHITIQNLKPSSNGTIRIAIFSNEKGFKDEKEDRLVICEKSEIINGKLKLDIPIKQGTYGISVLDDENNSGKMEYKLIGIPKEGFGFSNYSLKLMKKPKFNDFSFRLCDKETKEILVSMKYY